MELSGFRWEPRSRTQLFALVRIDEFVGFGGAAAEQEFFHLLGEKFTRLGLDR